MTDDLFNATIKQTDIEEWVSVLTAFDNEGKIHIHDDGWTSRIVDPANVAYTETNLSSDGFTAYDGNFPTEGEFIYGANLSRISDVVAMPAAESVVTFRFETKHKVEMVSEGLTYNLNGINPDTIRQEPEIPDLDFTATASGVPQSEVKRAVQAAGMVSDHITFEADADDDTLFARAKGDTDDVEVDLTEKVNELTVEDDAKTMLSLDYLEDMVNGIPSEAGVKINLKTDFPVRLDFRHGSGHANTTMMLAPRIESD